ncbi:MAG: hypothetical protein WCO56_12095 [Verrucomicrobiota bacterium]
MTNPTRKSELALILCFLGIIGAVPVIQTCVELHGGGRVHFASLLHTQPTAKNLREYEAALEEKSVFQQRLRPETQRLLFKSLHDTGAKAVPGLNDWFFYRPDLRYLLEPDRRETDTSHSTWMPPATDTTRRDSVVRAITRFRDQLRERGIQLLVVPVPGKPAVYPDQLTRRASAPESVGDGPTQSLIRTLRQQGVETVDLLDAFRTARRHGTNSSGELYLARDTHWSPRGAALAAGKVSERLRELRWAPPATKTYATHPVRVNRYGDIIDMMQVPGLQHEFAPELVECEQVLDPALGPLVPSASDRPGAFKFPAQKAQVLVLGDSFCRIYQLAEPQSLGERVERPTAAEATDRKGETATKKLLPGSAGFISHLALALKAPVDAIVSDGGASTDVRRKLSMNAEILEGKQVVVWEIVERDFALGRAGWEDVPLPARLEP